MTEGTTMPAEREAIVRIAKGLTEAQRKLVLASDPDDITGEEGAGVEIKGAQYKAAGILCDKGLGSYTHGSHYYDMYWNNSTGLAVRDHLKEQDHDK